VPLAGIQARRIDGVETLAAELDARAAIPVTTTELDRVLGAVVPVILVDARMRKRVRPERQRDLAPLTIGLGPNFVAGQTTHLSIETQWGDELGAVVSEGATNQLGGEPRSIKGHARDRFVYAPATGVLRTDAAIAQRVRAGEIVATIGAEQIAAPLDGILRGLTHDGVPVEAGTKVLEVDPRGDVSAVIGIAERPRRIAQGVLGAITTWGPAA
jgi:xanthine dehydrogenase accessory factor